MSEAIQFYLKTGPYGFLSNFSPHAVYVLGKRWPTTEHFFQAQKFVGTEHEELIRFAPTAKEAARIGRERSRPLRADWETVKESVMRTALKAKFTQHRDLGQRLLATGTCLLVEHTVNDRYWADGGDGSGQNRLGHLLMELREELRTLQNGS